MYDEPSQDWLNIAPREGQISYVDSVGNENRVILRNLSRCGPWLHAVRLHSWTLENILV